MYYEITARLKAIFRWLVFHLGDPKFFPYSDVARETSGYAGWYEWRGRVIAFQRVVKNHEGRYITFRVVRVQFVW